MKLRKAALVCSACALLLLQVPPAGAGGPPLRAPLVAAAVKGNIWVFFADGTWRQELTTTGRDVRPVVSPDGQSVAFMRSLAQLPAHAGTPVRWDIMVARPISHGRYTVTQFSSRPALVPIQRAVVAWQPHSPVPSLAWDDGDAVVWKRGTSGERVVLRVGPATATNTDARIAWSPDGHTIAAPLAIPSFGGYPTALHVALSGLSSPQRAATLGFRPGVLLHGSLIQGSYPSGADLTLDGAHIIFGTLGRGAGGPRLTGEFMAPLSGGTASMIFGNGTCVHNGPCPAPLAGATRFELSPDGRMSATDPTATGTRNRFSFWVTGSIAAPSAVHIAMPRMSCVPAQWRWLPDSSGFAYVRACSSSRGVDLALVTVSLSGQWHVLITLSTPRQGDIDLAPATRCVACG